MGTDMAPLQPRLGAMAAAAAVVVAAAGRAQRSMIVEFGPRIAVVERVEGAKPTDGRMTRRVGMALEHEDAHH